jgi:hypothetical protein
MNRSLRFLVSILLWTLLVSWNGSAALAGEFGSRTHRVVAGDTIRGLLLGTVCVSSMQEYALARDAFVKLNPAIMYSGLLVPGSMISVPTRQGKHVRGCLPFGEQRVVRVEFETVPSGERVRVYLDGPVLPDVFMLKNGLNPGIPARVVCDFDGALPLDGLAREVPAGGRMVHHLRIGHQDKPYKRARVVLEIDESLAGRIEQEFVEQESLFLLTVHEKSLD